MCVCTVGSGTSMGAMLQAVALPDPLGEGNSNFTSSRPDLQQ